MSGGLENLDTVEPLARRVERHAFDRLIMLADGVFAIAVTLSALEIRVSAAGVADVGELMHRLAEPLSVYAVSFVVVSVFWMTERRSMSRIGRVDGPFAGLTLAFLALIALVPAGNRLLVEAHGPGLTPAFLAYLALILLISAAHGARWAYAAFVAHLVLPEVSARFRLSHLILTAVTPEISYVLTVGIITARSAAMAAACTGGFAALIAGRRALMRWADR